MQEVCTGAPLLYRHEVAPLERHLALEACHIIQAHLIYFAAAANLVYLLYRVLLHLSWHARRDRRIVHRALAVVICRLVSYVCCSYCKVVFALIYHRRPISRRILLILALLMFLQLGVDRVLVPEGSLVAQVPDAAVGRAVLGGDGREGGLVVEAEF